MDDALAVLHGRPSLERPGVPQRDLPTKIPGRDGAAVRTDGEADQRAGGRDELLYTVGFDQRTEQAGLCVECRLNSIRRNAQQKRAVECPDASELFFSDCAARRRDNATSR